MISAIGHSGKGGKTMRPSKRAVGCWKGEGGTKKRIIGLSTFFKAHETTQHRVNLMQTIDFS